MTKGTQGTFSDGHSYSIRAYKNGWTLTKRRGGKYVIAFTALDRFILEQMVAAYEMTGDYWDIWESYQINIIDPMVRSAYFAKEAN